MSAVNILKEEKNDIPTIFAWSNSIKTRAPPKEHDNPVAASNTFHCVGIMAKLHPDNHPSTCTRELVEITTEDKEVMVKPITRM